MDKLKKALIIIKEKIGLLSFCLLIPIIIGYFNLSIPKYMVFTIGMVIFIIADSVSSSLKNLPNDEKPRGTTRYIKRKGETILDKMDDSVIDTDYTEKFLSSVQSNDKKVIHTDASTTDITSDITKEVSISDGEIYDNLGIKL